MTTANTPAQPLSLISRIIIGAVIGLLLALYFIVSARGGLPEWGRFWMIQPIAVLLFAGSMAGLCNYYIMYFRKLLGVNRSLALAISIVVSLVGMWMGVVLGLHGTMWN